MTTNEQPGDDPFWNLMKGLADLEMSATDEQLLVDEIEAATREQPDVNNALMSNIVGYDWTYVNVCQNRENEISILFGECEHVPNDYGKWESPTYDGDPPVELVPLGNGDVFKRVLDEPTPAGCITSVEAVRREEHIGITYRADQVQFGSLLSEWLRVLTTHKQVHWDLNGGVVHGCQYCELGSQAHKLPINCIKFVLRELRRANTTTQELIEKWQRSSGLEIPVEEVLGSSVQVV